MSNDLTVRLDLENFLPYRLDYLAKRMSNAFSDIYKAEFGITVPEWRVTALLGEHGELTSSMVCKFSLMDKVKVSRAIKGLREKGWVIEAVDEKDNRAKHVSLTERGRQFYSDISPKAQNWEAELLNALKVSEYKDLLNVIDKLNNQLDMIANGSLR